MFQPGWIAQQAVGYVDLSYQALGTNNQLSYYTKPYGSGQNSAEQPFLNGDVIVPSPTSIRMSGLISPMASKSLLPLTFIALPCA